MAAADLAPRFATEVFDGEGGSYHIWSSSDFPVLAETKLGAGKLVLRPLGLALPHYADSVKVGFVLQGSGIVGLILPGDSNEKVVKLKEGNAIAVPSGAISWWLNNGDDDSNFVVVFLGTTTMAHIPGMFSYFFLVGSNGIIPGFSMEFITRTYNMKEEEAKHMIESQSGFLIIKLKEQIRGLHYVADVDNAKSLVSIGKSSSSQREERFTLLSSSEWPIMRSLGFSALIGNLHCNEAQLPIFLSDGALTITYIAKGSGHIQMVGLDGKKVINSKVTQGSLFVIPRFFVVSIIADEEGIDWRSIVTNPEPVFSKFGEGQSVLKAVSPQVLAASLNVNAADMKKLLGSKQ